MEDLTAVSPSAAVVEEAKTLRWCSSNVEETVSHGS